MYFGGIDGITAFFPDSVEDSRPLDAPLRITKFMAWEPHSGKESDLTRELLESGRIVLRPPVQSFRLSFTMMSFQDPEHIQYAYWVDGLDKGWTLLSDPTIQLARIPHGKYILHINGRGKNGQWSMHEMRIPLVVIRPLYLRPWFWVASTVFLAFAGNTWSSCW